MSIYDCIYMMYSNNRHDKYYYLYKQYVNIKSTRYLLIFNILSILYTIGNKVIVIVIIII